MGKRIYKTNPSLLSLVERLKKESFENKAPVWRDVADRLMKPRQNWAEVNLSRIERFAGEEETIIVPGKLLGAGVISKKVTVAAFKCSEAARDKIAKAGGKSMSIDELLDSNPKGANVRIMG
ncbi:MAG: 50S ribosomal protein L18e [Thermoplasmata archaeon]|nr:50S ribosomal protein L18e [Thermoplasmata archaeon]